MWCGNFDNCKEHLRIILVANHLAASHLDLAYMKKKIIQAVIHMIMKSTVIPFNFFILI